MLGDLNPTPFGCVLMNMTQVTEIAQDICLETNLYTSQHHRHNSCRLLNAPVSFKARKS